MRRLTAVLTLAMVFMGTAAGQAASAAIQQDMAHVLAAAGVPATAPGPGSSGSGGSGPDSRRPTGRVPVVLVHGALSDPERAWGKPSDPKGFYSFLCGIGYEPEVTLFTVDYRNQPDGDYAALYPIIHQAVLRARARSGRRRVDIVAHSMGSLMARYYLNSPACDGGVRTLVMMSPPNHGSFAASTLRSALSLVAQEDRRVGQRRQAAPGGVAMEAFPEFRGELDYVSKRAAGFYEPLYERFVFETRVLSGALPGVEGFEDWLARTMPDSYQKCFALACEPPLAPDWDVGDSPAQGKDLTRAYYEMLGLRAGRNNYVRFRGSGKTLIESVAGSIPPVSADPKQILKEYAARALFYIAGRLVDLAVTKGKVAIASLVESKFDIGLDSTVLRRLVPVDMFLRADDSPVLANHFLGRWASMEGLARGAADENDRSGLDGWPANVRYVVVTGGALLSSGPWMGSAGENDGAVEVKSAFLPLCADDAFKVFRGIVWPNHLALSGNSTVRRYVAAQLESYYPIHARHSPSFRGDWLKWIRWSESGVVQATPWEATYVAVDASRLKRRGATLKMDFSSQSIPQGLGLRAWVLRLSPDGQVIERSDVPLGNPSKAGALGASVSVRGLGSECGLVYLGVRLVGGGAAGSRGLVSLEDFDRSESLGCTVQYSLTVEPGAEPVAQEGAGEESDAAPDAGGEMKTIRAVRTSKKTVPGDFLTGERERWEWDFGDGSVAQDRGSMDLSTMTHAFSPGQYTVRARSVDAKGKVLREESWDVVAPPGAGGGLNTDGIAVGGTGLDVGAGDAPGEPLVFTAGGPDPAVHVQVSGPVMWMTGKPARFTVKVDAGQSGAVSREIISVEPGREFQMVWEKPGSFEVTAAAKVRLSFRRPGGTVSLTRTYTGSLRVKVMATSVTG